MSRSRSRRNLELSVLLGALLLSGSACSPETAQPPGAPAAGGEVAAELDGEEIALSDLDERARKASMDAFQALYEARSSALREMIDERLLQKDAERQGTSAEELLEKELAEVPPVSEADVQEFYQQNQPSMGGQTLEQMGSRIETFLGERRRFERRQELIGGLREQAELQVFLDPPRAELVVSADEPALGPVTAAVTIVEYSDFQ